MAERQTQTAKIDIQSIRRIEESVLPHLPPNYTTSRVVDWMVTEMLDLIEAAPTARKLPRIVEMVDMAKGPARGFPTQSQQHVTLNEEPPPFRKGKEPKPNRKPS